jgi:hypothetical protein
VGTPLSFSNKDTFLSLSLVATGSSDISRHFLPPILLGINVTKNTTFYPEIYLDTLVHY